MTVLKSPWDQTVRLALGKYRDGRPFLLEVPPGGGHRQFVQEYHDARIGEYLVIIRCGSGQDAVRHAFLGCNALIPDVFNSTARSSTEVTWLAHRRLTILLENVQRCSSEDVEWLSLLLKERRVSLPEGDIMFGMNTQIIGSVLSAPVACQVSERPSWLDDLFEWQVIECEPLHGNHGRVRSASAWFAWQEATRLGSPSQTLSDGDLDRLSERQWKWDLAELRIAVGELLKGDSYSLQPIHERIDRRITTAVQAYRKQMCHDFVGQLSYLPQQVDGKKAFEWASQFEIVAGPGFPADPWTIALRLMELAGLRYYYSLRRICQLLRRAYEKAPGGFSSRPVTATALTSRHSTIILKPVGDFKSSSGLIRLVPHVLGNDQSRRVADVGGLSSQLGSDDTRITVVFCDDFLGTGTQLNDTVLRRFSEDRDLKGICESRAKRGNPITLLLLFAVAFDSALEAVRRARLDSVNIVISAGEILTDSDRAFSNSSSVFKNPQVRAHAEHLVVKKIGANLAPSWPAGHGAQQALVVTEWNTPSATLPVFTYSGHVNGFPWTPLFPRIDTPND